MNSVAVFHGCLLLIILFTRFSGVISSAYWTLRICHVSYSNTVWFASSQTLPQNQQHAEGSRLKDLSYSTKQPWPESAWKRNITHPCLLSNQCAMSGMRHLVHTFFSDVRYLSYHFSITFHLASAQTSTAVLPACLPSCRFARSVASKSMRGMPASTKSASPEIVRYTIAVATLEINHQFNEISISIR